MKCSLSKIAYFLFVLTISCASAPNTALASESIKILVLNNQKTVIIENADAIETLTEKFEAPPDGAVQITTSSAKGVMLNSTPVSSFPLRISSKDNMLYLNSRPFRGALEVFFDEKGILVVNDVDVELYLVGLINHEISSKWNIEAVKTQAVIARTYALYHKMKKGRAPYHLEGTVLGQVYSGSTAEDAFALEAVAKTSGEIIKYNGELVLAVYHSNAGGYTEASRNVWSKDYPYLKTVESPYDIFAPNFNWNLSVTPDDFSLALNNAGYKTGEVEAAAPIEKTSTGRIKKIRIISKNGLLDISGEDLRRVLGYDKLKSTQFEITRTIEDGRVISFDFSGKGSGHGVGLSQWGAKGMAEQGYTYQEILKHYYTGVEIEKIY